MRHIAMGMLLAALVGVGAVSAQPARRAPAAKAAEPFALRDLKLGTSLEDFRAMAVPVDAELDRKDAHPVCTGDPLASKERITEYDRDDDRLGITTCQWFSSSASRSSSSPDTHWIAIGEGHVPPVFSFIDDGGVKRLFAIRMKANSQYYAAIRKALTTNYGSSKALSEPVQTRAGASLTSISSLWSNGPSSILLTERCGQIDRFCLTYTHERLDKLYRSAIAKREQAAASRI